VKSSNILDHLDEIWNSKQVVRILKKSKQCWLISISKT